MKGLNSKVFMVLMTLMGPMARASEAGDSSRYMLDLGSSDISSRSQVRVKVFPHDKDYKPHGLEQNRGSFEVLSEAGCQLQAGSADRAAPQGPVLSTFKRLVLDKNNVKTSAFIRCSGPFQLLRGGTVPSYSYGGSLYVRAIGEELEAINLIDLKNYLRGVVPSEVYRDWPAETLKTQAVAARTYAVYHLVYARRFNAERMWDVDDTINYQAYTGVSLVSDPTDRAIDGTLGQILTFRGHVIQAFYHADSGGHTEDALAVWNQPIPFTVARPEASELELTPSVWERTLPLSMLEDELRSTGYLEAGRSLKSVVIPLLGRSPSGRVKSLAIIDSSGQHKSVPLSVLRRVSGQLPSPLFVLEKDKKNAKLVVIRGVGFGHGVGMSQQGAAALAGKRAWDYKQILGYYYVNTALCSLDEANANIPDCKSQRLAQAANR